MYHQVWFLKFFDNWATVLYKFSWFLCWFMYVDAGFCEKRREPTRRFHVPKWVECSCEVLWEFAGRRAIWAACAIYLDITRSRSLAWIDSKGRVLKTQFWECQFLCLVFQLHHDEDLINAQAYLNFLYYIESSFSSEVTMTEEFAVVHQAWLQM